MSLKDKLLSPYVVVGATVSGWYGHSKYGKKHGYTAPIVGALAGGLAGMLVQKWFGGAPQQNAQIPPGGPQPQQVQQGQGDYVDLDDPGSYAPPPAHDVPGRAEYEADQASRMNLGSLSDGDGLGSLSVDSAFDADEIDYSDLIGDEDDGYHGNGVN